MSARMFIDLAIGLYNRGQFKLALEKLRLARSNNPETYQEGIIRFYMAKCLAELNSNVNTPVRRFG